jgi:hypothetical protein
VIQKKNKEQNKGSVKEKENIEKQQTPPTANHASNVLTLDRFQPTEEKFIILDHTSADSLE